MQWVELIGPHGIGKTTIRKLLCPLCPRRSVGRVELDSLLNGLDYYRPTQWGAPEHWIPFMECVERLITNNKEAHWARRRKFCKSIMRMITVAQDPRPGRVVWDLLGSEGMRLSFILKDPSDILEYFETMPVSAGVVILCADTDTIVARNHMRSPKRPDFSGLAGKGAVACAIAGSILASRTRILNLDASWSAADSALAIAKFAGLVKA